MPEEKVEEKVEYEPGKRYTVTARSSVQLLSIGKILYHRDTYTGVLDEEQLREVLIHVNTGALALEAVEESVQEAPVKKEVPKEVPKKEEPKKAWVKKETSETDAVFASKVTETTKTPLENAGVEKTKAEEDEGAGGKEEKEPAPEKDEKD